MCSHSRPILSFLSVLLFNFHSPAPQLSTSVVVVVSLVCGKINGCGTILSAGLAYMAEEAHATGPAL